MKGNYGKKLMTITTALALGASAVTGCGKADQSTLATQVQAAEGEQTAVEVQKVTEPAATTEETTPAPEAVTVKFGVLASQIQPALAYQLGYFEAEGVDVEIITFDAGPAEVEAFTSGDLDIIQVGDLPLLNGINNGVDLQVIAFYQSSTKDCQLGVRDAAGITSFADLKGKTVSVPFGSNAQPLLYEMLEAGGLTPEDVELVNLTAADGANALVSGDVDAAICWDPFISNAVAEGGITVLSDSAPFRPLVCPIASSSAFVTAHHDEVEKVLTALYHAGNYAKEHVDESAQLVADYFGAESSASYVLSINNKDLDIRITDEKLEALRKGAAKCFEYGIITDEVNIDEHIIDDFRDLQ